MVFDNKFLFSLKKSRSSKSSSSPRSVGCSSPIGSDKKKSKSNSKEETRSPGFGGCLRKKFGSSKGKEVSSQVNSPTGSASPTMASYLGLNRIKTRSTSMTLETLFSFENDKAIPVVPLGTRCDSGSGLAASGLGSGNATKGEGSSKREVKANLDHISPDNGPLRSSSLALPAPGTGQFKVSTSHSGPVGSSKFCTPENLYELENPKESGPPRYQALRLMTSAPRKRFPGGIKSLSHELNSKGVRPLPLWNPRRSLEEILNLIRTKFDKAKEEVNFELVVFAGDLLGLLKIHPELQVRIEDLLVLARKCEKTTSGEFWLQCEDIVQDLADTRQELPPGVLKHLHTRLLFILARCTRLLQFHKESWGQEEEVVQLRQSRVLHSADKRVLTGEVRDGRSSSASKALKVPSTKKASNQEQRGLNLKENFVVRPGSLSSPYNETSKDSESPANINGMSSWKILASSALKGVKESAVSKEQNDSKVEPPEVVKNQVATSDDMAVAKPPDCPPEKLSHEHMSKHRHNISWGYWGDQSCISEESSIICRICEEEVSTTHVEDHSRICALADRYDPKGVSVDERLVAVAVTLEKIIENFIQKDSLAAVESSDGVKISNASLTEESDVLSPKQSNRSRRGSVDMHDCFPEADISAFMDDMRCLTSLSCGTRFGPKSDKGMTTSSAGSMTPRSPIPTPRPDPIEFFLGGRVTFHDQDDIPQMSNLAYIARGAANAIPDDDHSIQLLLSCLEDLKFVIVRRKFDALIVETFGTRIEKLIQEKYLQLCERLNDKKVDLSSTVIDEDAPLEDDVVRSMRTSSVHPQDRTSIEDFEIIKEISRGAFGRVFLAKKRTTGDIFAIKVLKKADMIRKNAVESILAERDILIKAYNPFVVRFFYSFTCPTNLYLVMEYLNGGDFYSLLGKLECLDETNARVYIAEVVLALEYLHSVGVVHRDLKPDNLLIAHDGHVKLTDFGLSKVGLVNSTDDLSGPVFSGTSPLVEEKPNVPTSEHQLERQDKRSAMGTPDYLAPEILLGTGYGATADWWSVGIILFEFIVGVPPFHANNPQQIFENILNHNIPWPRVPEDISHEAYDLIDRLLTADPHQRLGARGAAEVKEHIFFKDINWHTLAEQKAAFVPDLENVLDTSYFQSRPNNENKYSSNGDRSGCLSNHHNEWFDECDETAEFEFSLSENHPFNNFSFKNFLMLACINYLVMYKGLKNKTQVRIQDN